MQLFKNMFPVIFLESLNIILMCTTNIFQIFWLQTIFFEWSSVQLSELINFKKWAKLFACYVVHITELLWIIINVWLFIYLKDRFFKHCTEIIYWFLLVFIYYCRNCRSYSALFKQLLYIVNFSTGQLLATI